MTPNVPSARPVTIVRDSQTSVFSMIQTPQPTASQAAFSLVTAAANSPSNPHLKATMKTHPVPTLVQNTNLATYELGNVKVQVTDSSINGDTKRSVRIIDKSANFNRGNILDIDGPVAKDLAALLAGLDL